MKRCTKCKKEFPITKKYFGIDKRASDGLQSQCRECDRKYQHEYWKTDRRKQTNYKARKKWRYKRPNYSKNYYRTINGYLRTMYSGLNYRCNNPTGRDYYRYGGRGIQNKFNNPDEFKNYVIDVLGYNTYNKIKGLQIDRIDNNGHYEKGNIRFVTPKENSNNRSS